MKALLLKNRVLIVLLIGVPLLLLLRSEPRGLKLKEARRWTSLSLAKFNAFSGLKYDNEKTLATAYAEGMEFLPTNQSYAIVSAEKLWLRPSLKAHIEDWYLLPEPYLRKHGASLKDAPAIFTKHGAGFEMLTVHTNELAGLSNFRWSPPLPPNHSGGGFALPLLWSKHPELCGGLRYFLDVQGWFGALEESVFTNYLRAAESWLRRDTPDTWIDTQLGGNNWADVHNGTVLLLRQAPTNMVPRLGTACEGNDVNAVNWVVQVLMRFRTTETVQALVRACEFQPKGGFIRGMLAGALAKLAKDADPEVQAAAEAALAKL